MEFESRLFKSETDSGISFVEWYAGRVAGAVFIDNTGYVCDEENSIDECTFAHGGYSGKAIDYLTWSPNWEETNCEIDRDFYMTALFCMKEGEPVIDRTPTPYLADEGSRFQLTAKGKLAVQKEKVNPTPHAVEIVIVEGENESK